MYRSVAVIGLGTLGGCLCKHISELENMKELTIVDYDVVESKNVFNSIYKFQNVGEYKVDALAEIIKDDVTVTKVKKKYIEGKTSLPMCDLVIVADDTRIGSIQAPLGAGMVCSTWVWLVGPRKAKEMFYPIGTTIDGKEAERMGLVSKAVPADQLDETVERLGQRIASIPKNQLMMQKMVINQAYENMGEPEVAAQIYTGFINTADPNDPRIKTVKVQLENLEGQDK